MLIGEFHHNLDSKSRLMIPSKLANELGCEVILARGFEHCLLVYPKAKWEEVVSKFAENPITKSDTRKFMRILLSGATFCRFDSQNRICIPSVLKDYAGINKEVAVLGLDDHLEIWDESSYRAFLDENLEYFSEIAEKIYE